MWIAHLQVNLYLRAVLANLLKASVILSKKVVVRARALGERVLLRKT